MRRIAFSTISLKLYRIINLYCIPLFRYTFNKQSRRERRTLQRKKNLKYITTLPVYISQFFSKKTEQLFSKKKKKKKVSRQHGVPNERHRRLIKTGCSIPLNADSGDGEEGCSARLRMATKKSASTVFSARPPRRLITVEAVDGWSGAIFAGSIGRKAGYALKCERRIPARPARGRRGSSLSLSFSSHQPPLTGSNVDLITGQTSRESRPGRDFISSPWWRMSGGGCDDKQGGRRGRIGPSPAAESAKSAPVFR